MHLTDTATKCPSIPSNFLRGILAAMVFGTLLLAGNCAQSQPHSYDPREVAMLPPYCKHTQVIRDAVPGGNDPVEIERWTRVMGSMFIHMHHYCWGLMATNRAIFGARTSQDRLYALKESISEFDYVIRHAQPNFVLLPEILTRKGQNLISAGRAPQGVLELQRAIELKPDYWPPYAYISDYYKDVGDIPRAREWLDKGLAAAPNTKALMRRLAQLDGSQTQRKLKPIEQ